MVSDPDFFLSHEEQMKQRWHHRAPATRSVLIWMFYINFLLFKTSDLLSLWSPALSAALGSKEGGRKKKTEVPGEC